MSLEEAVTELGPEVFNVVAMPNLRKTKEDTTRFSAAVKSVTQLLGGATADRSTSLVVLDISDKPFLTYSPGDHLCVYPGNAPEVCSLCAWCASSRI